MFSRHWVGAFLLYVNGDHDDQKALCPKLEAKGRGVEVYISKPVVKDVVFGSLPEFQTGAGLCRVSLDADGIFNLPFINEPVAGCRVFPWSFSFRRRSTDCALRPD